jgi:hypothetical protein
MLVGKLGIDIFPLVVGHVTLILAHDQHKSLDTKKVSWCFGLLESLRRSDAHLRQICLIWTQA